MDSGSLLILCVITCSVALLDASQAFLTTDSDGPATLTMSEQDEKEVDVYDSNAVELISISRTHIAGRNRFTIRLTSNSDDLNIRIQSNIGPQRGPESITEEGNGVLAVTFTVGDTAISHMSPWCVISDANFHRTLALRLNNADTETASQDIVNLPVIHVFPATEAVYEPGEDVFVSAYSLRNTTTGQVIHNMEPSFNGIDLDTGNFQNYYLHTSPKPIESADRISRNLTLMTSTHHMSGYLQLATGIDAGGQLVHGIQVGRSILVHPSNQTGPFPPDSLTFIDTQIRKKSAHGNELHICVVGFECPVSCYAVGETVSDIEVHKVVADGSLVNVPTAERSTRFTNNSHSVYWKFRYDFEAGAGDSNGLTTFQCRAYGSNNSHSVTKLVDVQAVIPGRIDPEASNVTVTNDPMNLDLKHVTFNCAVTGSPLPEVSFSSGNNPVLDFYYQSGEAAMPTGNTSGVASLTMNLRVVVLNQLHRAISEGRGDAPFCEVFSEYDGAHTKHSFHIPSMYD